MICDTLGVGQKRVICRALHKAPFQWSRIRPTTIFDPRTWPALQQASFLAVKILERGGCRSWAREYLFVVFSTLGGEVDANPTSPAAWCLPWCLQVRKLLKMLPLPIQLLEYQTDIRRCSFNTLGKLTPAHHAGAPTARGRWVCPQVVGESNSPIATAACQNYQLFE